MNKTNAAEFEQIAREIFAPIYPVIAEQIIKNIGITIGKCLDAGTGPGYLGLALAEVSDLGMILMDNSVDMLAYASRNISDRGLQDRVQPLLGDVHNIPLPDQSVDLVISRGSVFFWDDLRQAFKEIYRILAPGGMTYIGGGFGSDELKEQIDQKMMLKDAEWGQKSKGRMKNFMSSNFEEVLNDLNIPYEIKKDAGLWIIIKKDS